MTAELIRKLTYTERSTMVGAFKDGAPYQILDKINRIRNDFGHHIERKWKDKYRNKTSQAEVLQLLIDGIKSMEVYMEKARKESGL
jgi:hypothetical protein